MLHMLVVLIVLATVAAWRPAEAAQAGRFEGDTVVQWKSIPGDVTFEVPLKLTKLAPDITKVMVTCGITSDVLLNPHKMQWPLGGQVEEQVSAGQLDKTVSVVIPVTAEKFGVNAKDPTGRSATYQCDIMGFSSKGGGWQQFVEPTGKSSNTSLQLSPVPVPIAGTFTW